MKVFVLGGDDVEMAAIEVALNEAGERYCFASLAGSRVHGGNAYKADSLIWPIGQGAALAPLYDEVVLVECDIPPGVLQPTVCAEGAAVCRCDHHRPGDSGFGQPPEAFAQASSLGQVLALLGRQPSEDQLLIMAADHCLEAAYRSKCPGIDPKKLLELRVRIRAAYRKCGVDVVMDDIRRAHELLKEACYKRIDVDPCSFPDGEEIYPGHPLSNWREYADMRRFGEVDELAEAACSLGMAYIAKVVEPGGRQKVVLGGAPASLVESFLKGELVPGLSGYYGDPARGFAGGYLS